ncbi:UNVERIFIED_CONTAM: hypothetical protein HDU68_011322 [Siphonaria sp. JEL0065]|nr:hypothetical protein HDU68_011322 [Siphonaria sp. JEL0065]
MSLTNNTNKNAIISIVDSDSEVSVDIGDSSHSLVSVHPVAAPQPLSPVPEIVRTETTASRHHDVDDIQLQALKELASNQFGFAVFSQSTINNLVTGEATASSSDQRVLLHDVAGVVERDQLSSYSGKETKGKGAHTTPSTEHGHCAICEKVLPKPIETQTLLIKGIKPRFLREIKKIYPLKTFHQQDRICIKDVHSVMQSRIEQLLETDQSEFARLQDDAMKNLGQYEQEEQNWQKQFEQGWTMGERAADLVARFGGSWKFIGVLLGLLALWALANIILGQPFSTVPAWDPYPFILLNLFLSMLASLQAPIIMMSQNRQGQLDRIQSDYISKIVLRAEHQVRHVNAKIDHLLSHQWKRLLEIQEIQIDLLQTLQSQNRRMTVGSPTKNIMSSRPQIATHERGPSAPPHLKQMYWCMETQPDDHVKMLLAHHFGSPKSGMDDTMVFAHWHTDGDNFMGTVENVRFEVRNPGIVKRITYDILFKADSGATMDDVFAGEGTVTLRNDLDVKYMSLLGRIIRVEIQPKDKAPVSFANGDLPSRYKSTFFLKRSDKITDFWKTPITRVNLTYTPPYQAAVLHLKQGQTISKLRVDFFPNPGVTRAQIKMRILSVKLNESGGVGNAGPAEAPTGPLENANPLMYLQDVIGNRPLPEEMWKTVAHAFWPTNSIPAMNSTSNYMAYAATPNTVPSISALTPPVQTPSISQSGGTGAGGDLSVLLGTGTGKDVILTEALPVTVYLEEVLSGPNTFVFLCDETRVAFHGTIKESE